MSNNCPKISFLTDKSMRFAGIRERIKIFGWLIVSSWISACGNEESWTYKQWHNTLAHYNTYFNAEQIWLETRDKVREGYKEDFRKPIRIFNYGSVKSLESNMAAMDDAIKRASTMIDKHPGSKWVDDAYLLTGKAYLFKGDAIAALNIFDYVATQFSDPEILFSAKLWSVQSLLLQDKIIEAEAMATAIRKNNDLPKSLEYLSDLTLGEVYHTQQRYTLSSQYLEKALPKLRNRMDKYRVYFALGQSYQKLGNYSKSEYFYSKVPKFNPPYELTFNSQIEQVSILSAKQKDYKKANRILQQMLRDDKNIDYLGKIYYRMALNDLNSGNQEKAIQILITSVRNSENDNAQKTTSFVKLGDIHYENRLYEKAGLYYDSANRSLDEKHPDFEEILKKNAILSDLLEHLVRIKSNDSLIRMALDKDFRESKIKDAKKLEKAEKERLANQQNNKNNFNRPPMGNTMLPGGNNGGSSFPFYSVVTRKNGMAEFQRKWGKRNNTDYWKYRSMAQKILLQNNVNNNNLSDTSSDEPEIDTTLLQDIPKEDRRYYANLPLKKEQQDKMLTEIEESLLKSAEIYNVRLNEYGSSIYQYLDLLKRYSNSEYKPQVFYELSKLYRLEQNNDLSNAYKDSLRKQYPNSVYLKMLENPNTVNIIKSTQTESNKIIQNRYDSMIVAYQKGNLAEAVSIKLETDKEYSGNSLQPRFDFVYALCQVKLGNDKAFGIFEQLTIDYPNTDVAVRSKSLLDARERITRAKNDTGSSQSINTGLKYSSFGSTDPLSCLIIIPRNSNVNLVKASISDLNNKEFSLENIQLGPTLTTLEKYLITVENFESQSKTKFYKDFITRQNDYFASKGLFEYVVVLINADNLKILASDLDWQAYLQWIEENEP